MVKIYCMDGEGIELDMEVAKTMGRFVNILKIRGNLDEVRFSNIAEEHMKKVIEWGEHFKVNSVSRSLFTPLETDTGMVTEGEEEDFPEEREQTPWETEFLKQDASMLRRIAYAASYLGMTRLKNATTKALEGMESTKKIQ